MHVVCNDETDAVCPFMAPFSQEIHGRLALILPQWRQITLRGGFWYNNPVLCWGPIFVKRVLPLQRGLLCAVFVDCYVRKPRRRCYESFFVKSVWKLGNLVLRKTRLAELLACWGATRCGLLPEATLPVRRPRTATTWSVFCDVRTASRPARR